MKYNYLIVGAGLFGATFAQKAKEDGKSVLVIDKRNHIAGNVYTEKTEGINVHKYGAHIFHTNNKDVWQYVNRFVEFNRFTNSPVANYKGELYSLPFNMYTFNKMWGVVTPQEAAAKIEEQRQAAGITNPQNLEEQAISLVGRDIYEKLIKGYTEKQWGRDCKDLPAFIIKRLPVRFTFDNNYFNALYQGIPMGGYTKMVEHMLDGIELRLGVDYLVNKAELDALADKVIYTGPIDAYFDYKLGNLEYRSVRFENELLDMPSFQGNAAVNYTDRETPWTRIIEHKWFEFGKDENGNDLPKTVISREYSSEWKPGDEPYYPVNDAKNNDLYQQYKALVNAEENVIFGGRLGEYKYYDMDAVIASALACAERELSKKQSYVTQESIPSYKVKLSLNLDGAEMDVLQKYGKVTKGITREVIVPGDCDLDDLHYLIQQSFGWQDYHLHCFKLRSKDQKSLIGRETDNGSFMKFLDYCGEIFRFPVDYDDLQYDECIEDPSKMKKLAKDFANQHAVIELPPSFESILSGNKSMRQVKIADASVEDYFMYFEGGLCEVLETLTIEELLDFGSKHGLKLNRLDYSYDYGDGWEVDVKISKSKTPVDYPICVAADGLPVMDDVGGIWGYCDFLKGINDLPDCGPYDDPDESREWAKSMGWTGRMKLPKNIL